MKKKRDKIFSSCFHNYYGSKNISLFSLNYCGSHVSICGSVFFLLYIPIGIQLFCYLPSLFHGGTGKGQVWWVLVLVLLVTYQITGFFALHKIMIYIFLLLSSISKFLTLGAFNYRIRKVVEWCLH